MNSPNPTTLLERASAEYFPDSNPYKILAPRDPSTSPRSAFPKTVRLNSGSEVPRNGVKNRITEFSPPVNDYLSEAVTINSSLSDLADFLLLCAIRWPATLHTLFGTPSVFCFPLDRSEGSEVGSRLTRAIDARSMCTTLLHFLADATGKVWSENWARERTRRSKATSPNG